MKSLQEVFDIVANHLMAQKELAMTPNGRICAYRGAGGRKCAVGVLIRDEDYTPTMEGAAFHLSHSVCQALVRNGIDTYQPDDMPGLLLRLQQTPDTSHPSMWPKVLRTIAAEYKLITPACLTDEQTPNAS